MNSPMDGLVRRMQTIGELSELGRETLMALPFQYRTLRKEEELVADGDISDRCCLVVSGYLYRSKTAPQGARQIFSLHTRGEMPDLHSLHLPRMDHNLAAMSPADVATIPHVEVRRALEASPELNALFWRAALIDAAAFRAWLLMLGQFEAAPRMAHLFCEQFIKAAMAGLTEGGSFRFPLTQSDLADMLGISLVHANRTLQELRERGLLSFEQNRVTILRWEALRTLGHFDPSYLHIIKHDADLQNPTRV
ncbi:Crp/Fnr family transcriptional regulator [Devosia sp. PTR5]|uniref:Crp/Fnr family transcriptional regulator n=1 Tax=Devosia oryzisoli TaxID=2774138 RepID=A0A927IS80_9HYPH|nr:Crp/Fnr family transcriptional regulator [Devosia oryzisoli]MBD8064562.1 Crp/Fnr family transcriptional regulator [Devosia oryzisoli]